MSPRSSQPYYRTLHLEPLEERLVLAAGATIEIDGNFDDWDDVAGAMGTDPVDDQHDTDHELPGDTPAYVDHEDVDLLEFRVTHDEENLYFYFKATGIIGNTQQESVNNRAGRYYVIVTIDVDQNDATGYPLHQGGYYPTTPGYDANAELEFYNGAFNTGHYINHGAIDEDELDQSFLEQTLGDYEEGNDGPYSPGFVRHQLAHYDFYTQWVYQENDPATDADDTIVFVRDKEDPEEGNITYALSADGHELEMKAPYKGFLVNEFGNPIVGLGSTLDLSFSLEASGELANGTAQNPNGEWASDTADPINGYFVAPPNTPPSFTLSGNVDVDQFAGAQSIAGFAQNISKGAASESGQQLTFIVESDDSFFSQQPAIDPDTGNLTFTAAESMTGTTTVTVRLMDDGGNDFGGNDESSEQQFTITINPAPGIAAADNSGSSSDQSITFGTPLSQYRPGAQDSSYVRPALADDGRSFTITNSGAAPLTLYEIVINVDDVTVDVQLSSNAGDDIVLAPGGSQTFQLTFAPSLPSGIDPSAPNFSESAGIVLFSNAANAPEMAIELNGATTFNSDTNYDGAVNFADVGLMNVNFGLATGHPDYDPSADPTNDGNVNFADLGLLNVEFGRDVNNPAPIVAGSQPAAMSAATKHVVQTRPEAESKFEQLPSVGLLAPAPADLLGLFAESTRAMAEEIARRIAPAEDIVEPAARAAQREIATDAVYADLGGGDVAEVETLLFDFDSILPQLIDSTMTIA